MRAGEPGLARRRAGKGFTYLRADGSPVSDAATLDRIRALAIPPAYREVWICADPHGHLQATGRDARGRKQYRYHARWRSTRAEGKFDRTLGFAARLPALRRRLARDLRLPGLPRDKVLAIAVSVLARTMIRVGNDEYARSNGSYGLTTLRDRNLSVLSGGRARLQFRGKGGKPHALELDDARLARLLRRCQQLRGQDLFQYHGEDGRRRSVGSGMVNDYLRDAMGAEFTAKDFRTWGGTLRAVEVLARTAHPRPPTQRALDGCITAAVREVAAHLHNTPAVCRASYIHPAVPAAWCDGSLHRRVGAAVLASPRALERAALGLLRAAAPATRGTAQAERGRPDAARHPHARRGAQRAAPPRGTRARTGAQAAR